MIKKERYVPSGMVEFKPEIGDYPIGMFQCFVNLEEKTAIFYIGKQGKHSWYNRFKTEENMKQKIKASISSLMTYEEYKEKRKETRKEFVHSLKVGDILESSWGYDQTNISFYQVTKLVGTKSVEIREIGKNRLESTSYGTDEVMPVKDSFLTPRGEYDHRGEPMLKRVGIGNCVGIESYETAYLWDGKVCSETSLGWGH